MAGSEKKYLNFALVVKNAPWWNVGVITQQCLAGRGYEVELTQSKSEDHQLERVAGGDAHIGIVGDYMAGWALTGTGHYNGRMMPNLRAIAFIGQPQWFGFAVRQETRLRSMEEIREQKFPLRLYTYRGSEITGGVAFVYEEVLRAYDMSFEKIEEWGGRIWTDLNGGQEAVREGDFDAFFKHAYASYGPVGRRWQEATIHYNMRFLPLREDVMADMAARHGMRPGTMPDTLMRGVDREVRTLYLKGHVVYVAESMDDDLAYLIAQSYHEHADLFALRYVHFGYNPFMACRDVTIPLHPGAERFYRKEGFLK